MKQVARLFAALVAAAVFSLGITFAQDAPDDVLQRYGAALESLQQSVAVLDADGVRSRDLLDSAAGSLRLLAPQTSSPDLITDMELVFERARTAIQNLSRTDLEVQVAVLRGGMQRAVLESALLAAGDDFETARARFLQLAADLGFDSSGSDQLIAAGTVQQLRAAFDTASARRIAASLELVPAQLAESRNRAYETLADAYGRFLHVQDAPATAPDLNERFMTLIGSLIAEEDGILTEGAAELAATFQQMGTAVVAPIPTGNEPAAAVADAAEEAAVEATAEPAAEPAVTEPGAGAVAAEAVAVADTPAAEAGPAAAEPVAPAPVAAAEAVAATSSDAVADGDEEQLQSPADAAAEFEAALRKDQLDRLRTELARTGLRGQPGEDAAAALQAAGFNSLDAVFDQHYALAGQLVGAVTKADAAAGQQLLKRFASLYGITLAPVFAHTAPAVNDGMLQLTRDLQANPSLRLADVQLLTSQLGALDTGSAQVQQSLLLDTQLLVGSVTMGWPRLILTIVAALLALIPLILLGMAFGGGNRNWQLINSGIFLLLLPVIYEGIAFLAELAASLTGLAWLQVPASFSLFHSPLMQTLWLLLMIVAVVLMSIGLYGICVQFGLVGQRSERKARARGAADGGKLETKTLIDWDEEF